MSDHIPNPALRSPQNPHTRASPTGPARPDLLRGKALRDTPPIPPVAGPGCAFTFRPWAAEDADLYRDFLNDPELWKYMPETRPVALDLGMARDLIDLSRQPAHHMVRAVVWQDQVIGQVRLQWDIATTPPRAGEVSYWLGRRFQGRRLAGPMIAQFLQTGFRAFPALQRITARIHRDNTASLRTLARLNFTKTSPPDAELWGFYHLNREQAADWPILRASA